MLDFASVRDLGLWRASAAEASFIILYFCPCFLKLLMYNCCIRRNISSKYLVRNVQPQLLLNDFLSLKYPFHLKVNNLKLCAYFRFNYFDEITCYGWLTWFQRSYVGVIVEKCIWTSVIQICTIKRKFYRLKNVRAKSLSN